MTRALVLRAPGINCDRETAHACRLVGFETDLLHINQLLKEPGRLLDYTLLVIPGGFSYGDDLGAGTLLAKNLTVHLGSQLQQFIDEERLVLGICNGFQVLVRAGLLPGHVTDETAPTDSQTIASLTDNTSAQFECRWVTLEVETSMCVFTQWIRHPLELPVAHGEGQFVLADAGMLKQLQKKGQLPLVYASQTEHEVAYPANPNGSIANIAGICNAQGNVLGLMPHPERYVSVIQHPLRKGSATGEGDGLLIFKNAFEYAKSMTKLWQKRESGQAEGARATARVAPTILRDGLGESSIVGATLAVALAPSASDVTPNTPTDAVALASSSDVTPNTPTSYASSGVDIAAADRAKDLMKDAVRATHGPEVLAGMGAFAGMLDVSGFQQMRRPALVASTDGVGTKTLLAAQAGRFDTIGHDLVHHSVNDLLTQGAKPLFFMDYLAMGRLEPVQAAAIVRSVAEACREVGCALLGGETAEMPDVYLPEAFDLAGTIVGVVEQEAIVNGAAICAGDVLLGLPASGLHTNGYSLARRIFAAYPLNTIFPELGEPLIDALLRPHRCYLREVQLLREQAGIAIKGMAHITGGGFAGNITRILPSDTQAVIETQAWTVPPLFQLIERLGAVSREEMYRTLNMGVGMVLVLSAKDAEQARYVVPELFNVGYITEGEGVVLL